MTDFTDMKLDDKFTPPFEMAQTESIKLIKNTKGYNWEIRLIPHTDNDQDLIKRMEQMDKAFKEKFPSPEKKS